MAEASRSLLPVQPLSGWASHVAVALVAAGQVPMILNGRRVPSIEIAARLARALGVSLNWLVGGGVYHLGRRGDADI